MYILKTESRFDSAHFLSGYKGKCRNIHGHEWRVIVEVCSEELQTQEQARDMVVDFSQLKDDLRSETDRLDHALIIEKGSLQDKTLEALHEEKIKIVEIPFRPTAERLARYFHERMTEHGYSVRRVAVYETPLNCAVYEV